MTVLFQGYYNGKKLGNPRTEQEKNKVESYFKDILWSVIPQQEESK